MPDSVRHCSRIPLLPSTASQTRWYSLHFVDGETGSHELSSLIPQLLSGGMYKTRSDTSRPSTASTAILVVILKLCWPSGLLLLCHSYSQHGVQPVHTKPVFLLFSNLLKLLTLLTVTISLLLMGSTWCLLLSAVGQS